MLPAFDQAWMAAMVASSLDVSVPISRKTPSTDAYGHDNSTYAFVSNQMVNVTKPTATQLQLYASLIGSQWALILRYLSTVDIREGDQITYNGHTWLVQNIQNAESYTFANEALITVIT